MRFIALVPLLPFIGALLNGVLLKDKISQKAVTLIACGSSLLALVVGVWASAAYFASSAMAAGQGFEVQVWQWIPAGDLATVLAGVRPLEIGMGFLLDPLSIVMLFVVTFVGFWIHLYSVGYMEHEEGYQRYFAYLNLFLGAMLLLILGNNYLVLFVGWEGVGLCSYLLIGFYFDEEFPPYAGRKAFIVNRIGDFAFVAGLLALLHHFGTLNYGELNTLWEHHAAALSAPFALGLTLAGFVALAFFIGATGKSAQIPLFVWLPDAMAGPTPVSALIHAATMVTAGVYMVVRSNGLYVLAPEVLHVVAVIGALTAVMAATIAIVQTDIKKVLAYSTVSQLGFMFLAAGCGAYVAAVFHLLTHAFFKALLFLGSGSVIHAMGGEQNIEKMGGLKKALPQTHLTFLVGTLAIAGVPGLAGFFSKDAILAGAWGESKLLWAIMWLTAGMTAFYMFRLYFLTFRGQFRGTDEQRKHLHESPSSMVIPLGILALGSVFVGYLGKIPFTHFDGLGHFLAPLLHGGGHETPHSVGLELLLVGASVVIVALGAGYAWSLYGGDHGLSKGAILKERFSGIHALLRGKYFVDEVYDASVVKGTWGLAHLFNRFDFGFIDSFLVMGSRHLTVAFALLSGLFDRFVVDGLVNWVATLLQLGGRGFRRLQTGLVSAYALALVGGLMVLMALVAWSNSGLG